MSLERIEKSSKMVQETPEFYMCYEILLHIFEYLSVEDRARAACVCKQWNGVSRDRCLWRIFRPNKGNPLIKFESLINALASSRTRHLDLQNLQIADEIARDFFPKCIRSMSCLEVLKLPDCSATVMEELFTDKLNVSTLNARITFGDRPLNLRNIRRMSGLRDLSITSGKYCMPVLRISRMSSLRYLKNLTHLSMTKLDAAVMLDLNVISNLEGLRSLVLGFCYEVPDLSKLIFLERLRLEFLFQLFQSCDFLRSVSQMPLLKQLEIVNFYPTQDTADMIKNCKYVDNLLLVPSVKDAETNTLILRAVVDLKANLKSFTWGVTEILCGNLNNRKPPTNCIPVVEPIPDCGIKLIKNKYKGVPHARRLSFSDVEKIMHYNIPLMKKFIIVDCKSKDLSDLQISN